MPVSPSLSLEGLRADLRNAAPVIVGAVFDDIAPWLIEPYRIDGVATRDFNDPIWNLDLARRSSWLWLRLHGFARKNLFDPDIVNDQFH